MLRNASANSCSLHLIMAEFGGQYRRKKTFLLSCEVQNQGRLPGEKEENFLAVTKDNIIGGFEKI